MAETPNDPHPATIMLDVHAHLIPTGPQIEKFAGVNWNGSDEVLHIDGHAIGLKPLFRRQALLDWMDLHQVATAWISAPPPTYRPHLPLPEAAAWVEFLNTGLAALAGGAGGRLAALRHLPVEHPALAAAIAAEPLGAHEAGFSMASGQAQGSGLSDSAYEPLWRALADAGHFLLIHPGESGDARLAPFYLGNLVGNPVETGIAAAHLVLGGVPHRYPAMKICLAHAGGITAILAGRLQRGFDTSRPDMDLSLPPPASLLRRLWVDCIAHDPAAHALAASVHGQNHILFGSDWPFPMGLPEPHAQLAGLPADQRAALFRRRPG